MHLHIAESLNATNVGFWGKRTATLDWCEENYVFCKYIAEFHNTTTNALFILLAIYGMYLVNKLQHEMRFHLAYASFMLVGIGSWCFHMTLLYEMQLLDELPMLYATCMAMYTVFETKEKPVYGWKFPALLVTVSAAISGIYLFVKSPIFHQVFYGLLTAVMVVRAGYNYNIIPPCPAKDSLRRLLLTSWIMYTLGFLVWNIDNNFCPQLRAIRASVGSPFDTLFQLHGWWHVLTAFGCFSFILYTQYSRLVMLGKANELAVEWKMGILPSLVARNNKAKLL
ncbi:alkaline ceramidase 3-like protein [Thamnocephalis sphaerospora]|uniref:Alkaline ceramidase 3-like protein n=1 Tax=Thamnocephalis sphaerospora TaxID=78915 RepID=A0A4P9XZH9_9FUNG|nr:alkaline ceramidase 3-like protein [Thamnocephalis sphaerospora]|eukprot:RKP10880.1 alkaline ceramidase 3-like protein [Thamnocephalis sphaerospora]